MITLYGLSYRVPEFTIKSVESIVAAASEPFRFIIANNKSDKDFIMEPILRDFEARRLITCTAMFDHNIKGRALTRVYNDFTHNYSENFIMFTDLDILVDFDWIKETREMMKENVLSGYTLSKENYTEENGGHDEIGFGFWLMAANKRILDQYNDFPQDYKMLNFFKNYGSIKRSNKELYHMGWDLHEVAPDYYEDKKKGIVWDNDLPDTYRIL